MNKKMALVDLLQASIILTAEQKLAILDQLPSFVDKQVDALGRLLAMEQQFIESHSEEIIANARRIYAQILEHQNL